MLFQIPKPYRPEAKRSQVRSLYRSPLDDEATSKLSPWLAHGCLSPRVLYEEVQRYVSTYRQRLLATARGKQEYTHSGIGIRNPYNVSHRIVRELLWRDFTRFGSIEAGTNIFKIGGRDKSVRQSSEGRRNPQHLPSWRWSSDRGLLQAWIDGRILGGTWNQCSVFFNPLRAAKTSIFARSPSSS